MVCPESIEGDAVTLDRLQPVRQLSINSARSLYREVGFLIDTFEKPCVLADALVPDCPVIGVSNSFAKLSGYSRDEILGQNCRFLLKDVPGCRISRSGRRNLRSMIRMCRLIGLSTMGSTSCCQTNMKRDGNTFLNMFAVGLVLLNEHPFLVGVQCEMASDESMTQVKQDQHAFIEQIRVILQQGLSEKATSLLTKENFLSPRPRNLAGPAFSPAALTDRVILLNDRRTVMRREPCEIPNGCVVISENPIRRTRQGLFFALRMEGVLRDGWHSSWPMLGLSTISPEDMQRDGYPLRAEWCGKSVCIGGEFQAFVREKEQHFHGTSSVQEELQKFEGPQPRWRNRPTTPWDLGEGDVMGMLYAPNGDIHLMLNYETVLTVSTGKPLEQKDYYALVDCRGQAYELMLLPYEMPVVGYMQELALQPLISHKVVDHVARSAASLAVAECSFSVSIADPSQPDMPLVAVSPAFETMTGYPCAEIVGLNCRFLNHDCEMSFSERAKLRRACQTGKPFTGLLQNRRKTGELFVNLLDMRGLCVAKDAETGEDIWYLVGIQSDVTDLVNRDGFAPAEIKKRHGEELRGVAENLRRELQKVFAEVAVTSRHSMVETAPETAEVSTTKDTGDAVVVPAVHGVQAGPKPCNVPMIALVEPDWLKYDSVDDDSEPEQAVLQHPPGPSQLSLAEKPCRFGRRFRRGLCLRFAGRRLESSIIENFLDLRARSPTRSSQSMSISLRLRLAMGFDGLHTLPGNGSGFHLHPHDLHFGDESLLRRQCLSHSLRASNRSSRGVVASTCKQAKKHCQPQTKANHLDWWRRIQYLRHPGLHSHLGKVEQVKHHLQMPPAPTMMQSPHQAK